MSGEHLSPDLLHFLRCFDDHGVRYLIVGGEAVIHHGYPRVTGDLDLYWQRTEDNARRVFAALRQFWDGPVPAIADHEELLQPGYFVQFGRPPNRVDLLNQMGTVDFDGAWSRRVRSTVQTDGDELPFPILGLDDLLQAKRDAGRLKDLADIEYLTKK